LWSYFPSFDALLDAELIYLRAVAKIQSRKIIFAIASKILHVAIDFLFAANICISC
jgi:hypothetical protein